MPNVNRRQIDGGATFFARFASDAGQQAVALALAKPSSRRLAVHGWVGPAMDSCPQFA
jgi:hypothetical protein